MSTSKATQYFRRRLLSWHKKIDRNLPWKETNDPYKIWISEIILQQTRVKQGTGYYIRFIERFPTVNALASATEDEVLALWKGLGYYARARNLHTTAKDIVANHEGLFPSEYKEIQALKGIGPYTAAAIASFAFDKAFAVVDGNVYRILSRVFGVETPIDTTEGKKHFARLADACLDKKRPADFNQAIMDFGALQCVPVNPECHHCPLQSSCIAVKEGTQGLLPIKSKKIIVRNRFFHFLLFRKEDMILVGRRNDKDIWQGLFQLPLIETDAPVPKRQLQSLIQEQFKIEGDMGLSIEELDTSKQRLSHQLIHGYFYLISPVLDIPEIEWMRIKEVRQLGLPKIISDFINHL